MKATIYHNPRCSKSREALAILQDAGAEIKVVDYLRNPPSREQLAALYARAGLTPREGLRTGENAAKPLKGANADAILDAMVADPILIERPLVETAKGVVLGRPPLRRGSGGRHRSRAAPLPGLRAPLPRARERRRLRGRLRPLRRYVHACARGPLGGSRGSAGRQRRAPRPGAPRGAGPPAARPRPPGRLPRLAGATSRRCMNPAAR